MTEPLLRPAAAEPGHTSAAAPEPPTAAGAPLPGAGSLFVVVAPSGAGKTSLVRALLEQRPGVELSVSFTTRAPRPGERDGIDYRFVDRADFERRRAAGEFLEWAEVHGNLYGTSRDWIAARIAEGRDIVLEIDWQGAHQVQRLFPDAVGVFIAPPSMQALRERLRRRGQDSEEVIERRMAAARDELLQAHSFQYVIINQDFTTALSQLATIVDAAGLRFPKQQARERRLFAQRFLSSEPPAGAA
jgi:guanylate kinase